jgi:hypothetical protein
MANPSGASLLFNVDLYGIGFGSSDTDPAGFPTNLVFKNTDVPNAGDTVIATNLYTIGEVAVNNIKNTSSPKVGTGTTPANFDWINANLAAFLNTRPAGAAGRYAFLRLNHDSAQSTWSSPPIEDGARLSNGEWAGFNCGNSGNNFELRLSYTPLGQFVTNFTVSPAVIEAGEQATLSWTLDAGVTNVVITPEVGNVTGITTGGVGSTLVSPTNDLTYTLEAYKNGQSQLATVRLVVTRSLATSLLDIWEPSVTRVTFDAAPGAILGWTSAVGRAVADVTNEFGLSLSVNKGIYVTNATPNGKPAIQFNDTMLRGADTNNPLADSLEFTVAMVMKVDTNNPPTANANHNWQANHGIVDSSGSAIINDWGVALRSTGQIIAGTEGGIGDSNLSSAVGESVIDGFYHIVIFQWNDGVSNVLYIDDSAPVANNGGSTPRTTNPLSFGSRANNTTFDTGAYFRGNLAEVRFYNDAVSSNSVVQLRDELAAKYGLILNPDFVTDFTATPSAITNGGSSTLNWVVDAAVTQILLNPGNIDVTGQTVGGVGSTSVSPTTDTVYTLTAYQNGYSESATTAVEVQLGLAGTLVDYWEAQLGDVGFLSYPLPESLSSWTSKSNRIAYHTFGALQTPPSFVTNAAPSGAPGVYFTNGFFAYDPLGAGVSNPVGGLSEFTLAVVFKVDTNELPVLAGNNWYNSAGLVDAEQVGAVTADWGSGIKANGGVAFGIGGSTGGIGDTTVATPGTVNVLDNQWHVLVGQWGPGGINTYIDQQGPSANTTVPTAVRNDANLLIGAINGADLTATNNTVSKFFRGWISEIRFYNDKVSASAVAELFAGLGTKYGITYPSPIPETPTNLVAQFTADTVTLTWPTDYQGWVLQSQTNTLGAGLQTGTNAWHDVPGSEAVTTTNFTIYQTNPAVLYRLRYP